MALAGQREIEVATITLLRTTFDAPPFIDHVERLLNGCLVLAEPETVIVVQVDNWFDSKWLGFSGKLLGAVGVSKRELTVPPFHPNRVLREVGYSRVGGAYEPHAALPALHLAVQSAENTRRYLRAVAPGVACFWYTSESVTSNRGALMAYVPVPEGYAAWYVAFAAKPWRLTRRKGLSPAEVESLDRAGLAARAG